MSNKLKTKFLCFKAFFVFFLLEFISIPSYASESIGSEKSAALQRDEISLFDLNPKWKDQDDKVFNWVDKVYDWTILSMMYTTCESTCPLIIQKVTAFQKKLPEEIKSRVRVVLLSFDPKRDTPLVLKKFAKSRKLDMSHLSLLTSSDEDARTMATILDFKFKKMVNGEFSHSNQFTILNREGKIVHQSSHLDAALEVLLTQQKGQKTK